MRTGVEQTALSVYLFQLLSTVSPSKCVRLMSNPKRQHSVPKFILERFTDSNGLLYIYDKSNHGFGGEKVNSK